MGVPLAEVRKRMQIEAVPVQEQLRILCSIATVKELNAAGIRIGEIAAGAAGPAASSKHTETLAA